jgi:carbonic anhydrase
MNTYATSAVVMFFALLAPAQEQSHHPHWSYEGESGPTHWGDLTPEFATCKSGHEQSPINITNAITSDTSPIRFEYKPSPLRIIDNGHTVQVNYAPGSFMSVGDKQYELKQLHFHHPSEERIKGKSYELVAHLVHADPEGKLAVVAVLFIEGQSNPVVKRIFNHIPQSKEAEETAKETINAADLLPDSHRYFTFAGSLTTPPCTEGVAWFLLPSPVTLSNSELASFTKIYPHNARPVQALNNRKVLAGR